MSPISTWQMSNLHPLLHTGMMHPPSNSTLLSPQPWPDFHYYLRLSLFNANPVSTWKGKGAPVGLSVSNKVGVLRITCQLRSWLLVGSSVDMRATKCWWLMNCERHEEVKKLSHVFSLIICRRQML
ncbi:hypothetical protein SAY87_001894 [Trapa incisa]|uniref:Uncharacterized protein n=1 Tax=Trapa incisa TaxID=236973 RepID=A0AAN7JW40_9MYRT|nr:hypothetical protein SAY87_001894 [Trapa incisa]